MEEALANLAVRWELGPGGRELLFAFALLAVAGLVFAVALTYAGVITWLERRVAGRTQSRIGPNRVGPFGFLQWLADGIKMILKEDVIPERADRPLFRLAPYAVMLGVFSAFVTLPFGSRLIAADLDVGVLFLLAVTSLVVVGVLMAGWASNNKWSLLGGVRAAAQIVSYELPAGLAVLVVVLGAGSLSMQDIIRAQGGAPWDWFVFRDPFCFAAFFIYFTAAVAEGNRIPFDLPEAESELVAGYNTEYSGIRFGGFFLGEFANVYLLSAIATSLFLGGWQIPGVTPAEQDTSLGWQLMGFAVFFVKAWALVFVVIWLRWTLPRLRVDQLMGLCYRYLIPLAFVCLLGASALLLAVRPGGGLDLALRLATTGLGAGLAGLFLWRVRFHIRRVGDRVCLDVLQRGRRGQFDHAWQARRYGAHRGRGGEAR
jgi:NADH-quinone oxidoreductase subunit H